MTTTNVTDGRAVPATAGALSHCKVCNTEDFAHPDLRPVLRDVFAHELLRFGDDFPRGREYRKYWEVAMAVRAFRAGGVLHEGADVLGVGAGNEPTIFHLTRFVRRVFATDLYLADGWEESASSSMLTTPDRHWPSDWNPRRLVVQHMDALDLRYEDETMDAVFSSSSIEHFGEWSDVHRAMDEIHRVLRPGGVAAIATEFRIDGPPPGLPGALLFTRDELLEHVVGSRDWDLMSPLDVTVSDETMTSEAEFDAVVRDQASQIERFGGHFTFKIEYERYPHIVLRHGDHAFTSVHLALRKRPRGPARFTRTDDLAVRIGEQVTAPITVVDAGARWGTDTRWSALGATARVFGFEPDGAECARLEADAADNVSYEPLALGRRSGTARLHVTAEPACSSFYRPIAHLAATVSELDVLAPAGTTDVAVTTLDDWCARRRIAPVHVLKLDTQGSELDVLQGAVTTLQTVELVEAEVELNPLYEQQPLFGDVDAFLRAHGFVLWRLGHLVHYTSRGLPALQATGTDVAFYDSVPIATDVRAGQLYWAHAWFVRADVATSSRAPIGWDRAIVVATVAAAHGFPDLAVQTLRRAARDDDQLRFATAIQRVAGFAPAR